MNSLWNENEAANCRNDLELRAYSSRLLGQDKSLVLHGGGNTSVKGTRANIFGEVEDVLFVKGSGWDLETIQPRGFTPVRLSHLVRLARLNSLTDMQMVNEFRAATLDPAAPGPSVEAILHATIPFRFVDHTHADAVVTLTNSSGGQARIQDLYGDRLIVIPYLMPGFELAQYCARAFAREAHAGTVGMVLMNHGIFTWAEEARTSYELMVSLVGEAERVIATASRSAPSAVAASEPMTPVEKAELRREISSAAGFPVLVTSNRSANVQRFLSRADVTQLTQQGPATPDHIIRTKRIPMLGTDKLAVDTYVADYKRYFADNVQAYGGDAVRMVDPAPRVVLDVNHGTLFAVGRTAKDCRIANEIYEHTMRIQENAEALGGWRSLPQNRLFQVEYWDLEQAKLALAGKPALFTGEIALVTGAARGIGAACVASLLARGAVVIGVDIAAQPAATNANYHPIICDLADDAAVDAMVSKATALFGGLDILILNAGIFPSGKAIAQMDAEFWRKVQTINVDSNAALMRCCHPFLARAPQGGRVVVVGSKNVPAPGPGAAAYSASKAALTQLARVAAMEWGVDHIRVNIIHPNAVFDTGLWTDDILRSRAASYGLTVEQYRKNNILGVEIASRDVAELAAEMCGPIFAKTTGAQVPLDGGNDRVI